MMTGASQPATLHYFSSSLFRLMVGITPKPRLGSCRWRDLIPTSDGWRLYV
jgi:hypothetical protein